MRIATAPGDRGFASTSLSSPALAFTSAFLWSPAGAVEGQGEQITIRKAAARMSRLNIHVDADD
jgi:hypothetical protein